MGIFTQIGRRKLAACLVIVMVGAVGVALSGAATGGGRPALTTSRLKADFATFERAQTPSDTAGATPHHRFPGSDFVAGSERRVPTSRGTVDTLTVGSNSVCLENTCNTIDAAQHGYVLGFTLCDASLTGARSYGLVPDGVTSVDVALSGGRVMHAPITANVFDAVAGSDDGVPVRISWESSNGQSFSEAFGLPTCG